AASNREKAAAKKGGGGGADGSKDKDKDRGTAAPTKRYRMLSSAHLPPGWEIIRIEQPEKHKGYACRWYVYKYGNGSNLPNLKFKNLRDVEDFVHSDLPGANIHRRALEKGKRQTEASVHATEWRAKNKKLELLMAQRQEQEKRQHSKGLLKTHSSGGSVVG
ncbi:unnamed protein product, partial [Ectocarpus fasciculatus]